MSLLSFMTASASTKRILLTAGKGASPSTHLESVSITPLMLPDSRSTTANIIRQAIGLEGTAVQIFETYTQSHTHTDDSSSVTQVPDIQPGDKLIVGSTTYNVRWAEQQPATTSFGATLLLYVTEDKRA